MGPGEIYTIFKLNGGDAAAAYTMREQERSMAPTHWNLYIAVADADQTAKKAAELGAKVLMQPFDVMTFGRMAVIMDPTGAAFCIWQAKDNIGTSIGHEPGTLCWSDLYTGDVPRAKQFYEALFGWEIALGENDKSGYLHIKNGGEFIGGIPPREMKGDSIPPNWNLYYLVTDCAASTEKAKSLGARIFEGPIELENVGKFSVVADPQGAVFSLFEPEAK